MADDGQAKKIAAQAPNFTLVGSILYFIDPKCPKQKRAVVPVHLREEIMRDSHGGVMAGHFSGNRLFTTLRFRYSDEKVQDITAHNKEFLNNHAPYQLLL